MAPRTLHPLAKVRKECHLTQKQMARKLCLCVRQYQELEYGGGTYAQVERCAEIFSAILGRTVNVQYELHGLPIPAPLADDTRTPEWLPRRGARQSLRVVPAGGASLSHRRSGKIPG